MLNKICGCCNCSFCVNHKVIFITVSKDDRRWFRNSGWYQEHSTGWCDWWFMCIKTYWDSSTWQNSWWWPQTGSCSSTFCAEARSPARCERGTCWWLWHWRFKLYYTSKICILTCSTMCCCFLCFFEAVNVVSLNTQLHVLLNTSYNSQTVLYWKHCANCCISMQKHLLLYFNWNLQLNYGHPWRSKLHLCFICNVILVCDTEIW